MLLVWYDIRICSRPALKFFPGLYSGIFALYLRHCAATNSKGIKFNAILFYALCVLYVLSGVMVTLDMIVTVIAKFVPTNVSNNKHFFKKRLR